MDLNGCYLGLLIGLQFIGHARTEIIAWAEPQVHGATSLLWCNITNGFSGTEWQNENGTALTRECNPLSPHDQYIVAHPDCSRSTFVFVFNVTFDRKRDCYNWSCENGNDRELVEILPKQGDALSSVRVSSVQQNSLLTATCESDTCAFPYHELNFYTSKGNLIVSNVTRSTVSCEKDLNIKCELSREKITYTSSVETTVYCGNEDNSIARVPLVLRFVSSCDTGCIIGSIIAFLVLLLILLIDVVCIFCCKKSYLYCSCCSKKKQGDWQCCKFGKIQPCACLDSACCCEEVEVVGIYFPKASSGIAMSNETYQYDSKTGISAQKKTSSFENTVETANSGKP